MKTLAEQIGNRCVHFTGMGHDACAAGVVYATVRGKHVKGFAGIPCFRDGESVPCALRHFPTQAEVDAEVAEHDAQWEMMKRGIAAVSEDAKKRGLRKGNGGSASVACPVCDGGTLSYSVAGYNGHMHGRCSTPGCVAWMQ